MNSKDILTAIASVDGQIKSIVKRKVFTCDDQKRIWINRFYGGANGLYREVKQNIVLKLLIGKNELNDQDIIHRIYAELKHQLYVNVNFQRREICESEFGLKYMSLIDSIPEIIEDYNEADEHRLSESILDDCGLNEKEKVVLKYHFFEDMNYDMICTRLGLKRGHAQHIRSTAIDKMRMKLCNA